MAFIVGGIIIGAGASIAGAVIGAKGSKSAAKTAAAGSEREIEFNEESRDLARADQAPYREAGYTALDALMSMTGLKGTGGSRNAIGQPRASVNAADYLTGFAGDRGARFNIDEPRLQARRYGGAIDNRGDFFSINETGPENVHIGGSVTRNSNPQTIAPSQQGYVQPNSSTIDNDTGYVQPNENPGGVEGGYNFMTDPGYEFRLNEGQRVLERGAAAKGGLLSGGFGRKAIRYGQDYASGEYTNVYNRISNIAGLGQVSANQSGNAALYGGARAGNAASQGANASAYGQIQSGNAYANAANQVAQLPWGNIFGGGNSSGGPRDDKDYGYGVLT